jgi:hypothetical protein
VISSPGSEKNTLPLEPSCLNVQRGGGVAGVGVSLVRTLVRNPLLVLCT